MATEGNVADALMNRVSTITSLPIAYPDVKFTRAGEGDYLDIALLPNGTINEGLGDTFTLQGILQITLVKKSGGGVVKSQTEADEIAQVFEKGTEIQGADCRVCIYQRPTVGASLIGEAYTRTPITINYYAR